MANNFMEQCSHEWKIQNFLSHSYLQSVTFAGKQSCRIKWKLCWKRIDSQNLDSCSLILNLVSAPRGIIWAKYSLTFKSQDQEVLFRVKDVIAIFNNDSMKIMCNSEHSCIEQLPSIIRKYYGECCGLSKAVTPVILFIAIEITAIVVEPQPQLTIPPQFINHTCQLAKDIASNFDDDKFSDVIVFVGKSQFKAHKLILAARSSVFATMLQSDFLEKKSGCISITDFTADIIKQLMHFIYSGDVEFSDFDTASELLRAAEKYCIEDLQKLCIDYLVSVVDSDNVLDVLLLGDMYAPDLKRYAMDYFITHLHIHDSSDFQNIENLRPNLLTELLLKMVKYCSTSAILNNLVSTEEA